MSATRGRPHLNPRWRDRRGTGSAYGAFLSVQGAGRCCVRDQWYAPSLDTAFEATGFIRLALSWPATSAGAAPEPPPLSEKHAEQGWFRSAGGRPGQGKRRAGE